jgi:hypothetical protein
MEDEFAIVKRRYETWISLVRRIFFWRSRPSASVQFGQLPEPLTRDLRTKVIDDALVVPFSVTDARESYLAGRLPDSVAETVRANFSFLRPRSDTSRPLVETIRYVGRFAASSLGYPVRVVNVRMWSTSASSGKNAGANDWHRDGFPEGILKIMIYLTPPSREIGTTEVQLEDGKSIAVEGQAGLIMLFDNNKLLHRGVPPERQGADRIIVEVTVIPSLFPVLSPVFAGLNAQFPKYPWR